LKEITNWFAIMLWIGSILCIIIYIIQPTGNLPNLYLAFVLMIVVLLTGAITFAQGPSLRHSCKALKICYRQVSKVLRDGKITQIHAEKLVRGDIVEIIMGRKFQLILELLAVLK
jgi:sodium/potassium-transporting ATPase subunit alpha